MQLLLLKAAGLKQNLPDKFPQPVAGGENRISFFIFSKEGSQEQDFKTEEQDLGVST